MIWRPGHPSKRKLSRWLSGDDKTLDRHLSTCNYCADRLEPLLGDTGASIQEALLQLLDVPEELPEILQAGIEERINNQQDLLLISEFFGLPFRTVRAITSTDQGDD